MDRCTDHCTACLMASRETAIFYHVHRVDGAGGTLMAMLYAMAYAAVEGMQYGGALAVCHAGGLCHRHVSHNLAVDRFISFVLGVRGFSIVHANASYGQQAALFSRIELPQDNTFSRQRIVINQLNLTRTNPLLRQTPAPFVYYSSTYFPLEQLGGNAGLDSFFSADFLSRLRGAASCRLVSRVTHFRTGKGRLVVAMHVRRGDVINFGMTKKRFTPDAYYLRLADTIKKQAPSAQFHVYSHTERAYRAASFDIFTQKGFLVHLDDDPLDVLAHLAQADVFVMAKSAFSSVAAFLNHRCVIYEPFWYGKLLHWAYASTIATAFLDCLAGRLNLPDDAKRVAFAHSEMIGRR
ncbi:hypothetical protein AB1Y20_012937 [Prymnesium parvum]|uniref:L-Fucosyltransferase n=1 Tax=Prymnesium parvum TaxID=97485 RepID=A0AB34IM14_PRYPA